MEDRELLDYRDRKGTPVTHEEGEWGCDVIPSNWRLIDWWRGSGYRFLQIGCVRFWLKRRYP